MSDEKSMPAEEQFTVLFAAGEAAVISGETVDAGCPSALPAEVHERLEKNLRCVQLLHRALVRPAKASAEHPRVAIVAGPLAGSSADLVQILRNRLAYFSLVAFVFISLSLVAGLLFNSDKFSSATTLFTQPPSYGVALCVGAIEGGLALLLRRRTTIALTHLRRMEWAAFAAPAVYMVWNTTFDLKLWLPDLRAGQAPRLSVGGATAIPFVMLIVMYGVFIPNTGRRCALATGLIASGAVIPCAVILLTGNVPPQHTSLVLVILCAWLGLAIAVVVYGATRVEFLRNEALEARKLGQYLLRRRLGAGGMGEVYLAEHVLLKQPCALKLIHPQRAGDAALLRRFEREVQATARLNHWNTVQIYDYGHAADGTFHYVMEYLPGLTLEQLVKTYGPVPPARAVYLLRQACQALREAHARGLIHRDIKPANLMICERGGVHDVIKVLDFGLVKSVGLDSADEKLTQEGAIAGTPAYMSPEQAGGKEDVDARSDIYSLGAVAYFLLTGQPPFRRDKPIQMIVAHIHEAPPLSEVRAEAPADLERVVLRCLEKDPAQRFADAGLLERALAACECAGAWTEDTAARWWQCHVANGGPPGADTVELRSAPVSLQAS